MTQRTVDLAPGLRNPENHEAMARNGLAYWDHAAGDLDRAQAESRRAVALAKSCGNPFSIGNALGFDGRLAREDGDLPGAASSMAEAAEAFVAWNNFTNVRYALEDLAEVAIACREPDVARDLLRGVAGSPMGLLDQPRLAGLADDVARFLNVDVAMVLAPGEPALPVEDLIALARTLGQFVASGNRDGATCADFLTPRQLEVLRLVAAGLSNRSIADRLAISERTVDNHVLAILNRLGVDSRTSAATWAVRHGVA